MINLIEQEIELIRALITIEVSSPTDKFTDEEREVLKALEIELNK